ncbi:MAG: phospho-N-acetylmuramoyl-pentapeptide-transferase [Lachnospiraceae bacterium]|nr:phospho-N-acetylmuramoyl-pentapeptide-transferase [Lachnospiraceae bacterium]
MESNAIWMPLLISFVISVIAGPLLIPFLRRLKVGQPIRQDGPKEHLKKTGTPTMGGFLILISVTVTSVLYVKEYPKIAPVLFVTLGFGLIGFLDDYLKIVFRSSEGLRPWQKLLLQLTVTGLFAYYMVNMSGISLAMKIPFKEGYFIDFGILNVPMIFVVVAGCANGTNFTDGLDGLVSSVTVLTATFFSVSAIGLDAGIHPIACAVAGALLGFLLFNVHPASVFMGDTGSLALGGFLAASAYMMQMPLFLPIVGFVYVAEVLSVVIQVLYFKLTGGKRIFKMAPLHHHFELCGYSENRIVTAFTVVTAGLCLVAFAGIF